MTEYIPLVEWEAIGAAIILSIVVLMSLSLFFLILLDGFLKYLDKRYGRNPKSFDRLKKNASTFVASTLAILVILFFVFITFSGVSGTQTYSIEDPNFQNINIEVENGTSYIVKENDTVGNVRFTVTNPDNDFNANYPLLQTEKVEIPKSIQNSIKEGDGLKISIINRNGTIIEEKRRSVYNLRVSR